MRRMLWITALAAACCGSCRKTLIYERYEGVPVRIAVDWTGVCTAKPEGMRAIFYPIGRSGNPIVENIAADGETVHIPPGRYAVVLFNNDSETILIRGEESYETIEAYTRTLTVITPSAPTPPTDNSGMGLLSMRGAAAEGVPVVNPPDKLFGFSLGELVVGDTTSTRSSVAMDLKVKPAMLVSQYCLCQPTQGGEAISRVRGAISGVPNAIFLGNQKVTASPSLIVTNCSHADDNMVMATFTCFGTATPQQEAAPPVTLSLELTLPDASKQVVHTNVTDVVAQATPSDPTAAPPPPVEIPDHIIVDYVPPEGDLDIGVGDWDDEIIPLPMNARPNPLITPIKAARTGNTYGTTRTVQASSLHKHQ